MRLATTLQRHRNGNRVIISAKRNNWRRKPHEGELTDDLYHHFQMLSKVGQRVVLKPGDRYYRKALACVPDLDLAMRKKQLIA